MFVISILWRTRAALQTLYALNQKYDIQNLLIIENLLGKFFCSILCDFLNNYNFI